MSELSPRYLALNVLGAYQPSTTNLSNVLNSALKRAGDSLRSKGFVRELVWETVRHLNTVDWLIDLSVERPKKLEPVVRAILRLGVTQVLFMPQVPEYAAVNESVELASKMRKPQAKQLVNAVLRGIVRKKADISWPDAAKQPAASTALRFSHPEWLVSRWLGRMQAQEVEELCQVNNVAPPLTIRTNTLLISRETLRAQLKRENVQAEYTDYSPHGLWLASGVELEALESLKQGHFSVQDEASQLVSLIVDPREGETILDLCAGAGIKTANLAQLTRGKAKITAVDTSKTQLEKAKENLGRLRIEGIELVREDARTLAVPAVDRVLLDSPCSGLGVIRRKPDIKWNRSEQDVTERYPKFQQELLRGAARLVKKGGVIVYSTCTTEPEENEEAVKAFLAEHPDFTLDKLQVANVNREVFSGDGYYLRTWPHKHGTDGFFAARLKKVN